MAIFVKIWYNSGTDMIIDDMKIDWEWVKESLLKKERIAPSAAGTILESANNSIDRAKKMAVPRALLLKKSVLSISCDTIELDGGVKLSGNSLSAYIKDAHDVYLFVVTIGSSIENEASELMKSGESLSGYLLDRIGSFAVESLAEGVEKRLRREYESKGNSVSMRFSPGYCDWPVEEQAKMDAMLDFSGISVRITGSGMMVPKKSISGLIGIGHKDLFSKRKSQCSVCNMKSCDYRRS